MCTCTLTGTTWRDPELSGTGPWQGTSYSVKQVRGAQTDYSALPGELLAPDEVTLTSEPQSGLEDSLSISDASDELPILDVTGAQNATPQFV